MIAAKKTTNKHEIVEERAVKLQCRDSRYPQLFRSFRYKIKFSLHTEKKSKYPSKKIRKRTRKGFHGL